jgi:hypothetical protein
MIRRRLILALLVLAWLAGPVPAAAPKKLLLVGSGPDGHPPQTHEYMAGLKVLAKCLAGVPGLEVMVVKAVEPWREGPELMQRADDVVLFVSEGARWLQHDPKRLDALRQVAARKGGLAVLHWGMGTRDAKYIDDFVQLFGGCHGGPDRKYKVLEAEARVGDASHPAVRGITNKFQIKDEFYYRLKMPRRPTGLTPLLRVLIDGNEETVAWAWQRPEGGRSFGFSGLHFHANWGREEYRRLVTQGIVWTLDLPIPKKGLAVKVSEEDLKLEK